MLASKQQLEENYRAAVFEALAAFQLIEGGLCDALFAQANILELQGEDTGEPCKGWVHWMDRTGLTGLNEKFAKMTGEHELSGRITDLVPSRNEIAHHACGHLRRLQFENGVDEDLHEHSVRFQEIADQADGVFMHLVEYLNWLYNRETGLNLRAGPNGEG